MAGKKVIKIYQSVRNYNLPKMTYISAVSALFGLVLGLFLTEILFNTYLPALGLLGGLIIGVVFSFLKMR